MPTTDYTSHEELLSRLRSTDASEPALSEERLQQLADELHIPLHRVQGVASFYTLLNRPEGAAGIIRICDGVTCNLHGGNRCHRRLHDEADGQADWSVQRSGCLGLCDRAPAALVNEVQVGPLEEDFSISSELALASSRPTANPDYREPHPAETRFLLKRFSESEPSDSHEHASIPAYDGLAAAVRNGIEWTLAQVEQCDVRGRGGAGFPTARKWRFVAAASGQEKYVVANADESEPLMFKDRALIESDPHLVVEGLAIAAFAVGATQAYIYIRGEYEPQARLLEMCIDQATAAGALRLAADSDQQLNVQVHRGAGAYICGEETALLESMEGRRGEPRTRPPFPVSHGFRGQPTCVNNVETLAMCAAILKSDAETYRTIGDTEERGTRLFTIQGHVRTPRLFEAPTGFTLREAIDSFGGGLSTTNAFRFALLGGASGVFADASQLDIPLSGVPSESTLPIGSGGIMICDSSVSPVEILRNLLHFFETESCGKCTPCRLGTREAREILDDFLDGTATASSLERLDELGQLMSATSFCGLGKSTGSPIHTALQLFRSDFEGFLR